jgi:hypothetical protein
MKFSGRFPSLRPSGSNPSVVEEIASLGSSPSSQ